MRKIVFASASNAGLDAFLGMHFGRVPFYTAVNVDADRQVASVETIANPYFENNQLWMIPQFLHAQGANVFIAGDMGNRAAQMFSQSGIEVVIGVVGQVRVVLDAYLQGKIREGAACDHDHPHDCGGCGHHH